MDWLKFIKGYNMSDVVSKLKILEDKVNTCKKCPIHLTKIKYVFARGNPESPVMLCGEASGTEEDKSGIPFVGRAGQCLDRAIRSLKFDPDKDCYICNILKCHPPNNRRPSSEEIGNCVPYLHEQIKIINPKVILALGNTASQTLLNSREGVTNERLIVHSYMDKPLYVTFHPSYIIRSGGVNSPHFFEFLTDIKKAFWHFLPRHPDTLDLNT